MADTPILIDSDTHVIESEPMWDLIERPFQKRRPLIVTVPENMVMGNRTAFWLIDGEVTPKPVGRGGALSPTPAAGAYELTRTDTSKECRELTNVSARLSDMDQLGIDIQVVYPTMFLRSVTEDPKLEAALCRAYNQWMAHVFEQSNGRIRWVVVPPLLSVEDSISEIRAAKRRGAVGVFMRGIEAAGSLAEPYFFPIFEEALAQDLPICIHSGNGSRELSNQFRLETNSYTTSMPVLMAFRDLVVSRVPESYPGLRFGFVENGSSWLPYAFYQLSRRRKAQDNSRVNTGAGTYFSGDVPESAALMETYSLYVTCMLDEDLPYILQHASPEHLIIGSDYGHVDPAFQDRLVDAARKRENVGANFAEAVLGANAARFYGLSTAEVPRSN